MTVFIFYAPQSILNHDHDDDDDGDGVGGRNSERRRTVDVGDVLQLYADAGLVTVLPWTLPSAALSTTSGMCHVSHRTR